MILSVTGSTVQRTTVHNNEWLPWLHRAWLMLQIGKTKQNNEQINNNRENKKQNKTNKQTNNNNKTNKETTKTTTTTTKTKN